MQFALLLLLACSLPAEAGVVRNKIADACSRLTGRDPQLTKNCVNHAELFEVDSEYIRAVVEFHSSIEIRMKALKSGASIDTLKLCKSLNWSVDNTLSCMRSYPTPELVKECKKVSARQEDQLRCVREGRDTAQVHACNSISSTTSERFACLELNVPALATYNCRDKFSSFPERMQCMNAVVVAREEEYRRDQKEMKERELALKKDPAYGDPALVKPPKRVPASLKKSK